MSGSESVRVGEETEVSHAVRRTTEVYDCPLSHRMVISMDTVHHGSRVPQPENGRLSMGTATKDGCGTALDERYGGSWAFQG